MYFDHAGYALPVIIRLRDLDVSLVPSTKYQPKLEHASVIRVAPAPSQLLAIHLLANLVNQDRIHQTMGAAKLVLPGQLACPRVQQSVISASAVMKLQTRAIAHLAVLVTILTQIQEENVRHVLQMNTRLQLELVAVILVDQVWKSIQLTTQVAVFARLGRFPTTIRSVKRVQQIPLLFRPELLDANHVHVDMGQMEARPAWLAFPASFLPMEHLAAHARLVK